MPGGKRPKWEMDEQERSARPARLPTNSGYTGRTKRVSAAMETLQEDPTPPPIDITALQAWEHTSSLAKKTANAILEIGQSAGVGMTLADDVQANSKEINSISKKMKWWQSLAIAAITAAGGALFGVAKLLYARGEHDGVSEMRLQIIERQVEQNTRNIEKSREEMMTMIRYRIFGPALIPPDALDKK